MPVQFYFSIIVFSKLKTIGKSDGISVNLLISSQLFQANEHIESEYIFREYVSFIMYSSFVCGITLLARKVRDIIFKRITQNDWVQLVYDIL